MFFEDVYDYLAFWDDYDALKRNRLHIFSCEDALNYIADDMSNCDSIKPIAEMYGEVLIKIALLLEDD